ncbi:MAG: TetR/AcrR family transcriptional regulator [Actinomycetota bacterium]
MSQSVKRKYDSTRRREQAAGTRSDILRTADKHFRARGYAGTTIGAVAEGAQVSVETVYKTFRNKPGLLKAVIDVAIVGDEAALPMLERDLVRRIEGEPDARRKLQTYGRHLAASAPRSVPLELLVRQAAASDPAVGDLARRLDEERLVGMSRFAEHLYAGRHLAPGVSRAEARDLLWTYISAELYELLVVKRGWSVKRYARWVIDQITTAIVRR